MFSIELSEMNVHNDENNRIEKEMNEQKKTSIDGIRRSRVIGLRRMSKSRSRCGIFEKFRVGYCRRGHTRCKKKRLMTTNWFA